MQTITTAYYLAMPLVSWNIEFRPGRNQLYWKFVSTSLP